MHDAASTTTIAAQLTPAPGGLVGNAELLKIIWPNATDRPCTKTLERMRKRRMIPFVRLGRLIYYNPEKVMQTIQKRFEISAVK